MKNKHKIGKQYVRPYKILDYLTIGETVRFRENLMITTTLITTLHHVKNYKNISVN